MCKFDNSCIRIVFVFFSCVISCLKCYINFDIYNNLSKLCKNHIFFHVKEKEMKRKEKFHFIHTILTYLYTRVVFVLYFYHILIIFLYYICIVFKLLNISMCTHDITQKLWFMYVLGTSALL